MLCEEIQVPAPWGYIAAKAWGDRNDCVVVCIHGILDNAGSFDTLIPLLPQSFYYVCVDLPGHGLSSHFDRSLPIEYTSFLLSIKIVSDFLARETIILLGHSLGARLCTLYAQLYPKVTGKLILLDSMYPLPKLPSDYLKSITDSFNVLMKSLTLKEEDNPLMSYEKVIEKLVTQRTNGRLTPAAAEQIARRMVTKVGDDQYRFTYDYRMRSFLSPPLHPDFIKELLTIRPIECPTLVFVMEESYIGIQSSDIMRNYYFQLKDFQLHFIERGHHHSHHTNPELVVQSLSKFLMMGKNKL